MSPLCDVCHASPAVVGPFCSHCSQALLDAEARRMLTLQKEGSEDLNGVPHPIRVEPTVSPYHVTGVDTWEGRERIRREFLLSGAQRERFLRIMGGGCE